MSFRILRGDQVGHEGSVLCLQFDDVKVISGSSDTTVRVWDLATQKCTHVLTSHSQSVLHLNFNHEKLITCSKDRLVIVWHITPEGDYTNMHTLTGHRAAVNVVEFDNQCVTILILIFLQKPRARLKCLA